MSLTPNTTVLPDYLEERNARAIAAGLVIEKQKLATSGKLTTWYRGSVEAFARSQLVTDADAVRRAGSRTITGFGALLNVYAPLRHAFHATLYRVGGEQLRLVVSNERLPVDAAVIRDGILVYWYERGWTYNRTLVKVYVAGTREELIEARVATRRILTNNAEYRPVGYGPKARRELLWRLGEEPGGAILFETYPGAIARAESRARAFEGSAVTPVHERDYERAQADTAFQGFLAQLQGDASDVE